MARYTELYSEWLENGGQVPAIFSEIEGFEAMFTAWYADKEIGFETPILFEMKLQAYAEAYIPIYAAKIAELKELEATAADGIKKVRVRSGGETTAYKGGETTEYQGGETTEYQGGESTTHTGSTTTIHGAQSESTADQPYIATASGEVAPTQIINRDEYTDTETPNTTDTNVYNDRQDVRSYNDRQDVRSYNDRQDERTYNNVTDTESGYTVDEYMRYFDWVAGKTKALMIECIKEFKPLFMVIYA